MAKVVLKQLLKEWKHFRGVDNVNLEINDGEFFVLLGPSGCGKTTTLRIIAGLEEATAGDVYIGEKRMNNVLTKDRDISMVFQNYGLYPHMTVHDNIAYPLKIRKVPKGQHQKLIAEAAAKVKLEGQLDKKPQALSGGQRQRVALARAIVRNPQCFLMDEPLSNLDAKLRVSTRAEIKLLQKELQTTTIYVTHDQVEAMTMADRIAIMNEGRVVQLGTPMEIYQQPKNIFVAGFIGSPPMNILKGELKHGSFVSGFINTSAITTLPDQPIYLGFRAEDAFISSHNNPHPNFFKPGTLMLQAAQVYNYELLGDSVMVECKMDEQKFIIKTHKDFTVGIGDKVDIKVDQEKCYFFEQQNGNVL